MGSNVTYDQFYQWIKQAEEEATRNPRGYRRKVGWFAWLGYIYIFTLLALTVVCLAGLVALVYFKTGHGGNTAIFKLGAIIVLFGWMLLSSLWIRFEPPEGRRITKKEFPALFADLEDLQEKLDTIPVHEVILEDKLNAAAVQTPRLGILGWQKNSLILGLQMLLILKPEEARAVIAHELGHLSGNHSKFSGWIYRVQRTWFNVMDKLEEGASWGALLVERFFYWYVPRFDAYSFALRRQNEYEADAAAAEVTSKEINARALVKVHVFSTYLDEAYWEKFFEQADNLPAPQTLAYSGFAKALRNLDLPQNRLEQIRQNLMTCETDYEDTHPALKDRLAAMGVEGGKLDAQTMDFSHSAAHAWLEDHLDEVLRFYDAEWWTSVENRWAAHYEKIQYEKSELKRLAGLSSDAFSQQDLWNLATHTLKHIGAAQALPVFKVYQKQYPEDHDADLLLGRILCGLGDGACLEHYSKIPCEDGNYIDACIEASDFLEERGRTEEAKLWQDRGTARYEELLEVQAERDVVDENDTFVPPDLNPEFIHYILTRLKQNKFVKAAWVAQKDVKHDKHTPVYVIAVRNKLIYWKRYFQLQHEKVELEALLGSFSDVHDQPIPADVFVTVLERFLPDDVPKKVRQVGIRIL